MHNGYRVFPGVKVRPGHAADHSPPSSAAVMEELSYGCTSIYPLGHTGPVTVSLYLYVYVCIYMYVLKTANGLSPVGKGYACT